MASVQDLKRRIRSVRNTRKITKAMELVASARLRRAQARIEAMRPYADRMMELMIGTARAELVGARAAAAPAPRGRAIGRDPAADRRPRSRRRVQRAGAPARVRARPVAARPRASACAGSSSGRKGASTLRFRRLEVLQSWTGFTDRPTYADAQALAHKAAELYIGEEVDRVVIVYNQLRLAARAGGRRAGRAADPEEMLEAGRGGAA